MARRRAFVRGASAIRSSRETRWLDLIPAVTAFSATGGTILFSLTAVELALRPFTIVRTRLQAGIIGDQLAAGENQLAGLGVAVVSDQALAIGVTAVPTPITDLASDLWLVHQLCYNTTVVASSVGFEDGGLAQYAIDSKAMRKVEDGQDIAVVVELSGASSGFNFFLGGRMLVKLH